MGLHAPSSPHLGSNRAATSALRAARVRATPGRDQAAGHRPPHPSAEADALSAFYREIGQIPVLTRAEEVEAARQIEAGEREILEAVLSTPTGTQELVALSARLRSGALALRDLIRDYNDQHLDPARRREQLLSIFDGLARRPGPEAVEDLLDAHLAWEPVRAIARRVKARVSAAQRAGGQAPRRDERSPGLPGEQLSAVYNAILRGERMADAGRARLVESCLWFVSFTARRQVGRGLPFLDLVQEGAIGLLRAAEKYDYHQGFRFSTYATWWIRSSITQALAEQGRAIRIPATAAGNLRRIIAARARMTQELGREPTTDDLADRLKLSHEQVSTLVVLSAQTVSLHQPVGDLPGALLGDFLEDDQSPSPADHLAEKDLRAAIRAALGTLSPREQKILRQRFGISGEDESSLRALGDELGLSRERIRQIELRALGKLRALEAIQGLEDYLRD